MLDPGHVEDAVVGLPAVRVPRQPQPVVAPGQGQEHVCTQHYIFSLDISTGLYLDTRYYLELQVRVLRRQRVVGGYRNVSDGVSIYTII